MIIPTTMDEQWIKEMQQKMADYQWPAPELSWDELDQALTANHPPKTRQLWLRRIAAAAVILLVAGVGYWGFLNDETEQVPPTTISENDMSRSLDSVRQNHGLAPVILQPAPAIFAKSVKKSNMAEVPVPEPATAIPVSAEYPDTLNITTTEDEISPRSNEENGTCPKGQTQQTPLVYPSDFHQRKHLDNRLTAKVYMSSTMTGSQIESFNLQRSPDYNSNDSVLNGYHVHHRQPVRLGLSLRYRLGDRWSIESGLSYTRLSSNITTIVNGVTTMTEQRLNYIGLPLSVSYGLWKSRYFGLYIATGAMIEKRLDASPWQFSLNGAVGAEYKLTDFFSLYAEPGIGYYFKDGST
ncbi:MAG: porin family protein, partial [Bacteroidaceae bacterium]|nr:porin family protein [Bacteroidaceae bacterium]